MNTKVWGPPLWRVLHGSSTLTGTHPIHEESLATIVRTLEFIMPCSFCRDSYAKFSRDLNIEAIETTLHRKQFGRWLYDLHNLVVAKLQRQALETAGVPPQYTDIIYEKTKLSYEVLQKRLIITYPYFSEADVFTVLGILALSATEEACIKRKRHFLEFARCVAKLLVGFSSFGNFGASLSSALERVNLLNFDRVIIKLLLGMELKRRPNKSEHEKHLQILGLAKAGKCLAGACL